MGVSPCSAGSRPRSPTAPLSGTDLAEVAAAIERHVDGHGPLDDPDTLIATLRGIIADFAFDLDLSAHLPQKPFGEPAWHRISVPT
jgi:hypothetical protein